MKDKTLTTFFLLVECNSPKHTTCYRIRDKMFDTISNLQSGYTTDVVIKDKHYCICANGFTNHHESNSLKRKIKKSTWGKNKVKYMHFVVSDT
mgnify:CR=1 FL=1